MSEEEKKRKRKISVKKSNEKRREKIKLWHETHKDRIKEIKNKYVQSERGRMKRKESSQNRINREKKLKEKVDWEYWKFLCKKLNNQCQGCGKQLDFFKLTLDHIVPINRGGDNDSWNLQPLCKSCNSRKQDELFFVDNIRVDLAYGDWLLMKKGIYE